MCVCVPTGPSIINFELVTSVFVTTSLLCACRSMKGVAHVTDYCRYVFTLILCIIKSVVIINCAKKYVQVRDLWYYNIINTEHDI